MNLNNDLVPIIRKGDIDKEATKFLQKYYPQGLKEPMAIPVEDIAELKMGLEIDYVNIDRNCDILGMMIFSDGCVELYDKDTQQNIIRQYKKGTLLVESNLSEITNRGRERFTVTHEMVHWDKHQLRFMTLSYKDKAMAKACRCPKQKAYKPKTADEWIEWQADNIAAAILMPAEMFRIKAEELRGRYKAGKRINDFLWRGLSPEIIRELIIDELASVFQVSKQAAGIRLNTLGISI